MWDCWATVMKIRGAEIRHRAGRLGPLNICKCLRRARQTGYYLTKQEFAQLFGAASFFLSPRRLMGWDPAGKTRHATRLFIWRESPRLPRNEFVRSWPLTRFLDRVISGAGTFFAPRTHDAHSPPRRMMGFSWPKQKFSCWSRPLCAAVTLSSIIFSFLDWPHWPCVFKLSWPDVIRWGMRAACIFYYDKDARFIIRIARCGIKKIGTSSIDIASRYVLVKNLHAAHHQ
jgi:hypothetical protein